MNDIGKISIPGIGSLDAVSYFSTLIREGFRLSLLSPEEMETIQHQFVRLLADQFYRRTGGQSSSIPVETGQSIQQSVLYTLGYYLKGFPDEDSALDVLKRSSLDAIFTKGKQRVEEDWSEARKLLQEIQNNPLETDIYAYNDTLFHGLPLFFSAYDMDYEAHETPGSVDYPLSNDTMKLTGIDYIRDYLRKLKLENEFCSCFSREEINGLLKGYDRSYKDLLFNVYDLVLANVIGCVLLERNKISLHISDYDLQYLQSELSPLPAEELNRTIEESASLLCDMLSFAGPLQDYIAASMKHISSRICAALETKGLNRLFLPAEHKAEPPVIRFEDKAAMAPESFRKLADELRACRYLSDKLALLKKKAPGLADLVDLLESSCFFGEEYWEVFASLEDIRLALLTEKLPLNPDDASFLEEECDREWQSSFNSFLGQLAPERRSAILGMAARLETAKGPGDLD